MIPFLENKKVWGFPYLKIKKLPHFHFMIFDRYDIHIQAFGDVFYGKFIIFRSSSSQNYFMDNYVKIFYEKYVLTYSKNIVPGTYIFQKKNVPYVQR